MIHDCDLCGNSDKFLGLPGDPSGKISICSVCGFVVVRERRSIAEVAAAWTDIYKNGGYDPEWPGVKARLFYVAEWLDQTIGLRGKSVLDIGAGNGQFLAYCRDRGADPWGLDPDRHNCEKMRETLPGAQIFQLSASDDMPALRHGQNDIVTLNWTLENTADCLAVLRYAKRCLAPGGHVVVSTGSRILVPFKKPLKSYLPQDPNYPHDTHCYRWSASSLCRAFDAVGLMPRDNGNDYIQRDEMIIAAHEKLAHWEFQKDHPEAVASYFRRWSVQ